MNHDKIKKNLSLIGLSLLDDPRYNKERIPIRYVCLCKKIIENKWEHIKLGYFKCDQCIDTLKERLDIHISSFGIRNCRTSIINKLKDRNITIIDVPQLLTRITKFRIRCENCDNDIVTTWSNIIARSGSLNIHDTVTCIDCINEKRKNTNQDRRGFDWPFQDPNVKEKIKQTNIISLMT